MKKLDIVKLPAYKDAVNELAIIVEVRNSSHYPFRFKYVSKRGTIEEDSAGEKYFPVGVVDQVICDDPRHEKWAIEAWLMGYRPGQVMNNGSGTKDQTISSPLHVQDSCDNPYFRTSEGGGAWLFSPMGSRKEWNRPKSGIPKPKYDNPHIQKLVDMGFRKGTRFRSVYGAVRVIEKYPNDWDINSNGSIHDQRGPDGYCLYSGLEKRYATIIEQTEVGGTDQQTTNQHHEHVRGTPETEGNASRPGEAVGACRQKARFANAERLVGDAVPARIRKSKVGRGYVGFRPITC